MAQVVQFDGEDDAFMRVEVTRVDDGTEIELVADESGTPKALTRLEESLSSVTGAGVALLSTVRALQGRSDTVELDEVSLELGLSFGVEGGVIVAKGTGHAEAAVTLTWRRLKPG